MEFRKKNGIPNWVPRFLLDLAERTGLEPATPGVTGRDSNQLNYRSKTFPNDLNGGCCRDRTYDPRLVRAMLSQLS